MGADPRFTKDARTPVLHDRHRFVYVIHLEADMVLAAFRVLLDEIVDRAVFIQRLDEFDLAVGQVHETDLHALRRHVERLGNVGRAIERPVSVDRVRQ